MYKQFCESNANNVLSYESYRKIINKKFNISFGYPKTDTRSECDLYNIKLKFLNDEKEEYVLDAAKQLNISCNY